MKCILLLFLLSPLLFSATPDTSKVSNSNCLISNQQSKQIEKLEEEIRILKKEIKQQDNITTKSFNGVSLQISAVTITITVVGVIIAVIGIIASIASIFLKRYIKNQTESISKMNNESKEIEQRVLEVKNGAITVAKSLGKINNSIIEQAKEIKTIRNNIDNNMTALYEKIKDEETEHILNRLMHTPEDISNLFFSLASRDLHPNHSLKIKKAMKKLKEVCSPINYYEYLIKYLVIICQFNYKQSVLEQSLNSEILRCYYHIISSCFDSEIVSLITDLYDLSRKKELYNYREHLAALFKALCITPRFNVKRIYSLVYKLAETKEFKFELMDILFNNTAVTNLKNVFAKDLVEEFEKTELTLGQNNTLINAQDILVKLEEERNKAELAKKEAQAKNPQ